MGSAAPLTGGLSLCFSAEGGLGLWAGRSALPAVHCSGGGGMLPAVHCACMELHSLRLCFSFTAAGRLERLFFDATGRLCTGPRSHGFLCWVFHSAFLSPGFLTLSFSYGLHSFSALLTCCSPALESAPASLLTHASHCSHIFYLSLHSPPSHCLHLSLYLLLLSLSWIFLGDFCLFSLSGLHSLTSLPLTPLLTWVGSLWRTLGSLSHSHWDDMEETHILNLHTAFHPAILINFRFLSLLLEQDFLFCTILIFSAITFTTHSCSHSLDSPLCILFLEFSPLGIFHTPLSCSLPVSHVSLPVLPLLTLISGISGIFSLPGSCLQIQILPAFSFHVFFRSLSLFSRFTALPALPHCSGSAPLPAHFHVSSGGRGGKRGGRKVHRFSRFWAGGFHYWSLLALQFSALHWVSRSYSYLESFSLFGSLSWNFTLGLNFILESPALHWNLGLLLWRCSL